MTWDVQDPPPGPFSVEDLTWNPGDVAFIPWDRLDDFKDGEGRRDPTCESSFHIRNSKKAKTECTTWSEYIVFWCSYGPSCSTTSTPITPPLAGTCPKSGPGSRPRNQKLAFNNHIKRGCQCHFIVKRYKDRPHAAEITFKQRLHVNKSGSIVHGQSSADAVDLPWGPKCALAPRLSCEIKKNIQDLLRAGWSVPDIFDLHCKSQFERIGDDRGLNVTLVGQLSTFDGRDDLITKRDLYNLKKNIDEDTWMYDNDDQTSVGKWIQQNPERVLFHQEYLAGPPEKEFLLSIQSTWQRAQMIHYSHASVLCLDSTFATNKYAFPFFTLVAFDNHQMGLPVAWSIQQTENAAQISTFLQSVRDKAILMKADWKPSCFIIDCAEAEVKALQNIFPTTAIYFCSWHVRRAWKDNLVKKVPNREKLLQMNDDLGDLMYAGSEARMIELWYTFQQKYHTENSFLEYFRDTWMDRTAKWMRAVRDLPRANQNTNGAVEAWHMTLKRMIRRVIGNIQALRLDRTLVFMFQDMLPYFWYQLRCKERGRVINLKKEEVVLNSLQLALHSMTDSQVSYPFEDMPHKALVKSCTIDGKEYIVRSIYSNFPSCSCQWADEGNMCKHQLKALLVKGHQPGVLVQQLGTRFGSEYGGIEHLGNQNTEISEDSDHNPGTQSPGLLHDNDLIPGTQSDSLPNQTDDITYNVTKVPTAVLPKLEELQGAISELLELVKGDDELQEHALIAIIACNSKIKIKREGKLLTGKKTTNARDAFVMPTSLTSKRRLGVVDLYHGGRQGKRIKANPCKGKNLQDGAQLPKGDSSPPDKLPSKRKVQRESLRQHLARLGKMAREGKRTRRAPNPMAAPASPPRPSKSLGTGGRDFDLNVDVDLNN